MVQDLPHIVIMDAGPAVSHTGKTSATVFYVFVDYMDDMYILMRCFIHPLKKGSGDVQGVTVLPFGASVQNKDLYLSSPSSSFSFFSFSLYTFAEVVKLAAAAK